MKLQWKRTQLDRWESSCNKFFIYRNTVQKPTLYFLYRKAGKGSGYLVHVSRECSLKQAKQHAEEYANEQETQVDEV